MTAQEAILERIPLGMQILTINQCHTGLQEARTAVHTGRTKGNPCLGCHCLPLTVGSEVQCHQCQTDWRDLGIPSVGDNVGKLGHM